MFSKELIEIKGEPFIIEMMYAAKANMMQTAVYEQIGFGNRAFVCRELWKKLQKLIPILQKRRQKLKICDAFRPPLAHQMMLEIIPMPGFFAVSSERSLHCHAAAIDCCLCDATGAELRYPTKVDAYTPEYARQVCQGGVTAFQKHLLKARHDYDNPDMGEEIKNRNDLRQLMESIGLEPIAHEWWHYNLPQGKDLPIVEWNKD